VTHAELGGSHYALVEGLEGGAAPQVDAAAARQLFAHLHAAIQAGTVRSCHDLSEGGLAVAVAEMAFAGGLGATIDLSTVPHDLTTKQPYELATSLLFAESNTRFLCEVEASRAAEFERLLHGVQWGLIGRVTAEGVLRVTQTSAAGETVILQDEVPALKECWQAPLRW
ncbi:MAG: AIR synthase-related protein, partial [Planctomycetota bacterium]